MNHADRSIENPNSISSSDEIEVAEVKDVKPVIIKSGRNSAITSTAPTCIKQEIKTEATEEYVEDLEAQTLNVSNIK